MCVNVRIIDIYGFQLPMTSFLAKIHTSNARRRIRETMSTEPRDSSKLISGGPRTVLLRHRARYKRTLRHIYMYIHAEKILTFSPARVCSPVLENLWFSLNGSFLLRFIRSLRKESSSSPMEKDGKRDEERREYT